MYNPQQNSEKHKNKEAPMFRDGLSFRGEIKLEFFNRYGRLINVIEDKNFIVDLGHELVIDILTGTVNSKVFRMAIGDDGTLTGQPFVPKTPDATWPAITGLFHELIRKNIDTTTQPTTKTMRFLASFASADIDDSSFSSSPKSVNEASLIISSGTETGLQQINKTTPDTLDPSEKMFSIRTFKSQPFDPADTLTLSITWTIFVQ
jgi:hypothetical protein